MALLSPRVPRLPPSTFTSVAGARCFGPAARCQATAAGGVAAAGPPSSELEAIRWGSAKLQGARDEMEDEVLLRPGSLLDGFSFAAVLDGHAGFSAVQFLRHPADPLLYCFLIFKKILPLNEARLPAARSRRFRDELYKECAAALDGGAVLSTKNLDAITASIQRAFAAVDAKLSTWSGSLVSRIRSPSFLTF